MDASKIPALRALLTKFEFAHVQAFPSVLRLLYHGVLLDKLFAMDAAALRRITGLRCHRVIDNAEVELDGKNFWVVLSFQLVHLLDLLPLVSWKLHAATPSSTTLANCSRCSSGPENLRPTLTPRRQRARVTWRRCPGAP